MYISKYNQYINENRKIPNILDYLANNDSEDLKNGYFYFRDEKINVEVRKENHKNIIKVINALRFIYGYYISTIIYDIGQSSDPNETKEFIKDIKYNIENTFIDNVFEEGDVPYTLVFEPKYSKTPDIIPNVLYHITESELIPKIKKYGLLPKANNRISVHPKRVYFALTLEDVEGLVENGNFWVDRVSILTVDITNIKDNIKFYVDINYPGGVYTDSKIPVSCIKKYEL